MKTTRYILSISIALCTLLASCVKDYEFRDSKPYKVATTEQKAGCIYLSSDMDKEAIFENVSEKGFYIVRKFDTGDEREKVALKAEDKFEYIIEDDLQSGLTIQVIPYIIDDGHEFKGMVSKITSDVDGKPMEINSVKYVYDDDSHITGKIEIYGKHFCKHNRFHSLKNTQNNPNDWYASKVLGSESYNLIYASNDTLIFEYECNNIGYTELALTVGSNSKKLSEKLDINTASLVDFNPEATLGMPHDVRIELNGVAQDEIGCNIDKTGEMTASNHFYKEKKSQVIFAAYPATHKAYFFFMRNGKKVYLPPCDVNIHSNWTNTKLKFDEVFSYHTSSNSKLWGMWDAGYENQHSNEYISFCCIDAHTRNNTWYSYHYSNYEEPWRRYYFLVAEDDDVYFSVSTKSIENAKVKRFIRVLAIKQGDTSPQVVGEVKYETTNKKKNYELFAKVGNVYYFEDKDSNTLMTWDSASNAIAYQSFKFGHLRYIGRDNTHFFYLNDYYGDCALYRMPISNLGNTEKVDLDINQSIRYVSRYGSAGAFAVGNINVYNGRIYQPNMMRSTSTTDLNDHEYYGLPDVESQKTILPLEDGIYTRAYYSDIMKLNR